MSPRPLNPVVHLELHTGDQATASRFYGELFGWRTEEVTTPAGSYLAFDPGHGLSGGVVQCPTQRALWLPYVAVTNASLATERARELGATVLLEPREGPAGWRGVVVEPSGGEIAFWQAKR